MVLGGLGIGVGDRDRDRDRDRDVHFGEFVDYMAEFFLDVADALLVVSWCGLGVVVRGFEGWVGGSGG